MNKYELWFYNLKNLPRKSANYGIIPSKINNNKTTAVVSWSRHVTDWATLSLFGGRLLNLFQKPNKATALGGRSNTSQVELI